MADGQDQGSSRGGWREVVWAAVAGVLGGGGVFVFFWLVGFPVS